MRNPGGAREKRRALPLISPSIHLRPFLVHRHGSEWGAENTPMFLIVLQVTNRDLDVDSKQSHCREDTGKAAVAVERALRNEPNGRKRRGWRQGQ